MAGIIQTNLMHKNNGKCWIFFFLNQSRCDVEKNKNLQTILKVGRMVQACDPSARADGAGELRIA